jgi:hypothetical protein
MLRVNQVTTSTGAESRQSKCWSVLLGMALVCLGLAACGGGGGTDGSASLGVVEVTVKDAFGAPVAGATVQGPLGVSQTDAQGIALVPLDSPNGTSTVTISRETFADKSVTATSTTGQVNEVAVILDRTTSPAGGSLTSRSGFLPVVNATANEMTFEIELVLVDGDSRPIENLNGANFALRACTPDPANERIDCVRGADANADRAYTPATSAPAASVQVPGGPVRPYAAALLLDQSGSILASDPTAARLFSAKAFLSGLGADDQALLAAFSGGPGAIIPTPPLTTYGPFRDRASGPTYFPTLDSLVPLVGGNTPLYDSLDELRQRVVSDASLPAGLTKAVVLFTDGEDTICGSPEACRARREQSIQGANDNQMRLFTIGLSSGVDVAALGELANRTGGAFLYADNAEQLLPLYGSLGRLLSLSLPTYRLRWTIQADSPDVFRPGYTLLGRVQVSAGPNTFNVPFMVGIP